MKRELNVASAILFVLGIGHLSLTLIMDRARVAQWLGDGLWATVPLIPGTDVAALQTTTGFWAGWGSFSIPLLLVAGLIRHLARHQLPVPSWVGWGLVVWAFIGGLMLVPSPFFVGVIPGLLIVRAARGTQALPGPVPGSVRVCRRRAPCGVRRSDGPAGALTRGARRPSQPASIHSARATLPNVFNGASRGLGCRDDPPARLRCARGCRTRAGHVDGPVAGALRSDAGSRGDAPVPVA